MTTTQPHNIFEHAERDGVRFCMRGDTEKRPVEWLAASDLAVYVNTFDGKIRHVMLDGCHVHGESECDLIPIPPRYSVIDDGHIRGIVDSENPGKYTRFSKEPEAREWAAYLNRGERSPYQCIWQFVPPREPVLVPWDSLKEVPINDWYRGKHGGVQRIDQFSEHCALIFGKWRSLTDLFNDFEHNAEPFAETGWQVCGKAGV